SILDGNYYDDDPDSLDVLTTEPDEFPELVDLALYRKVLNIPANRDRFFAGLNLGGPKNEWGPHLLALDELMPMDEARAHVEVLLGDLVTGNSLMAAKLMDECGTEVRLSRLGSICALAMSEKLHEVPAETRAQVEGAFLEWAVEREEDGWDVDAVTGELAVLKWRGRLTGMTQELRMQVISNLMERVHERLMVPNGDVGPLLQKFDWCVTAAKSLPQDMTGCPSSLRMIAEGKVPLTFGDGNTVLKKPATDLGAFDEAVFREFGLPLWPLMTAWRNDGQVVVGNRGIGVALSVRLLRAGELPGVDGTLGVDLGPGKEMSLEVQGAPSAIDVVFTKLGKQLRVTLPVMVAEPSAIDAAGQRSPGPSADAAKLEAIQAVVEIINTNTGPLPAAIASVKNVVETVHQHVRSVPILQADLAEARVVPEDLALQLQNRIADILTLKEQAIWRAVRNAGGVQKYALPSLRASGIVKSTPTLSRCITLIDEKLVKNGLSPCNAAGPTVRHRKSGGYVDDKGKTVPQELSIVEQDWAADPAERDTTIRSYLAARPEDMAYFQQTKP
ncbi:MAG: hypothetical protein WCL16_14315, partial [bacterium]